MYSYVAPYYVSTGHAGSAELFVIISRTAWFSENMNWHKIHTNFLYNSWDIYRTKAAQQHSINLRRSACSVIFDCPKLNLVERLCFKKSSNIKFHENPVSGRWVFPRGRKDREAERYDAANRQFSLLFTNAPKIENPWIVEGRTEEPKQ
jgi:hypothetical protein